tara:strand:+ start:127 stop:573 length:447 start_codon:yes stop_codon:yes gene_type:complete
MPNFQYKAGLMNVGSYQVSGKPFVSGNVKAGAPHSGPGSVRVTFPKVTRWVQVENYGAVDLYVGFSRNGVEHNDNYFIVKSSGSVGPLELKVTELHLSGASTYGAITTDNASVIAGLTFIANDAINNSSMSPSQSPVVGTNWSGSTGV